jgi:hypothetical protein
VPASSVVRRISLSPLASPTTCRALAFAAKIIHEAYLALSGEGRFSLSFPA